MPLRFIFALFFAVLATASAQQAYRFTQFLPTTPSGSVYATDVVADDTGNLYVGQLHGSIMQYPIGGAPRQLGTVPSASLGYGGVGGLALGSRGELYVSAWWGGTIEVIQPSGVRTVLARLSNPGYLALDASGNLFVTGRNVVRKVTPQGVVSVFSGSELAAGYVDGGPDAARFSNHGGIAIDSAGNLYVTETSYNVIRKITPNGTVSTLLGPAPAGAPPLKYPTGIAIDRAGNIYFCDGGNETIRKFTPDGVLTTIGGQFGQKGRAGGLGSTARFNGLNGIRVDAAGSLLVWDSYTLYRAVPSTDVAPPFIGAPLTQTSQAVGPGTTVPLTVAAASAGPLAYQWIKNGVAMPGATEATLTLASVTPADAGVYQAQVTNSGGTATSLSTTLSVAVPTQTSFTSRRSRPGGSFLWSIAASDEQLVTVGTNGTILTSADGAAWTARSSGTTDWLVGVTYGGGRFIAVGDRATVLSSVDGLAWRKVTTPPAATQRLNNVIYAAGIYVAVGEGGTIATSADGDVWTVRNSPATGWLRGLTYNAGIGRFAATGAGGAIITSADGITWEAITVVGNYSDTEALVAVKSYADFVGIGSSGVAVYATLVPTAASGLPASWNGSTLQTRFNARFRGLVEGANALFATGERGAILSAPSVFGPWASIPSPTTANLVSGVYARGTLFIVGEDETILQSASLFNSRLLNISTRGQVGTGAAAMISGFVVTGTAPKQVLLRAAGPALAGFGLPGTLAAPVLTLYDGTGAAVASNTGWATTSSTITTAISAAGTRIGAFPFGANSNDSALLVTLSPGLYTASVTGRNDTTGLALVEAYDTESLASDASKAVNISTRSTVTTATKMIAGFVIGGSASRRVLIRAVGPTLGTFGVPGTLAEPKLELFNSTGNLAGAWTYDPGTEAETRIAAQTVGGFALTEGSHDVAVIATLLPGTWTVQVSGVGASTDVALVEVYDLP